MSLPYAQHHHGDSWDITKERFWDLCRIPQDPQKIGQTWDTCQHQVHQMVDTRVRFHCHVPSHNKRWKKTWENPGDLRGHPGDLGGKSWKIQFILGENPDFFKKSR